jgi:hypothetical protein
VILMVPQDVDAYPTLGPLVCAFIEANLVFGPGDLRGQPARLDEEKQALVYRMYEVYPKGHPQAGRRRFKRCAISVRKGSAKTEFAAWIAACELHPDAPVRCIDWRYDKKQRAWEPIGGPVTDPYIPLVAYTEEQSEDLAYGALRVILELSTLADDFDIGLERILRKKGDGKAVALASSPDSRDGARTTFQHMDETHRWTLPRLVRAHQTMNANLAKRFAADPWSLETTTAPEPGTGSVAESTMDYAKAVANGTVGDSRLFFFHREASNAHDLDTPAGVRAAILEASGPVAAWADIDGIASQFNDPTADRPYLERVWLNRMVQQGTQAFDVEAWKRLAVDVSPVQPGDLITIGMDGSLFHDATAVVCTQVATGFQWVAGLWERPATAKDDWQVPIDEVDGVIRSLFSVYTVWRLYADPQYWRSQIALWRGLYGEERVIEWWTLRQTQMRNALEAFDTAIKTSTIHHDGHADLTRHIGNSRRKDMKQLDEQGKKLWLIQKERPDSPHKIDAAIAAVLSWEARRDAVAAGFGAGNVYLEHGVKSLADYL